MTRAPVRMPGVLAALAALAALAGCDPEIVNGAYLCGPEMTCPGGQVCSAATGTCGSAAGARPFACADGEEATEPDDGAAAATLLAVPGCPVGAVERAGCVPARSDVDWIAVVAPPACAGVALAIDLRYSAAFAPAIADLVAADGTVLASAVACDITGGIGPNDAVCLDTVIPADGRALVRISLATELDCDGGCDFTHYRVSASAAAP